MAMSPVLERYQKEQQNTSSSQESKKRSAATAGMDHKPQRSVKRRASKACQCCRSRKVRCNVVEHGAPCTNCRLDQVECIITESKRKRYVREEPALLSLVETYLRIFTGSRFLASISIAVLLAMINPTQRRFKARTDGPPNKSILCLKVQHLCMCRILYVCILCHSEDLTCVADVDNC